MATQETGTAVWIVDDAVSGNTGGKQAPLGTITVIPGCTGTDRTLYYVDSSGNVVGGPIYKPSATDVAVVVKADTGDQEWQYIEADVAISRGEVVARKTGTIPAEGVLAAATSRVHDLLGVAQHEIAAGKFGWVLRKGVGVVTGTYTADASIAPAASGGAAVSTEGTDDPFGRALEAASAETKLCYINCPG